MIDTIRLGTFAAVLALTATGASAAVLDFTDASAFETRSGASATGTVGGVNFTVTGSSDRLTYNLGSGPGATGGLSGQGDGIGLGNDEIGGREFVTVSFDRTVRLLGVRFLDLFRSGSGDAETVALYSGAPPAGGNFLAAYDATEEFAPGGAGYGVFAVGFTGSTFTFDVGAGNDGRGIGDFSLAGLELVPIPVPAGALLLGTALFGLGVARRRT